MDHSLREAKTIGHGESGPFGLVVDDRTAPGYMWKNRRAQLEFSEAETKLLDKDFNLRTCGSPLVLRRETGHQSSHTEIWDFIDEYGDPLEDQALEWQIGKIEAK